MADIADFIELRGRVDQTEKECTDHRDRLDEHDNALEARKEDTNRLIRWAFEGNGSSAESRLTAVEDGLLYYSRERIVQRLNCVEGDMAAVQRIADHAIQTGVNDAVNTTLDKRERTTIAKIKAWGPWFATGVVLLLGILDKVL